LIRGDPKVTRLAWCGLGPLYVPQIRLGDSCFKDNEPRLALRKKTLLLDFIDNLKFYRLTESVILAMNKTGGACFDDVPD
jgi:hypothetical protein